MPRVKPPAERRLGGERLLGQGGGMPRVGGHDGGADLDARHLRAGDGERGEGVQPEDVGQPGRRQAVVCARLELVAQVAQRVRPRRRLR